MDQVAGPMAIRRTYGPNKGRILQLLEVMKNASGTYDVSLDQNLEFRYSDDRGLTWSSTSTALDGSAAHEQPVFTGISGRVIEFPADSAYPNRCVWPYYTFNQRVGLIYTDDDGATWHRSNLVSHVAGLNETAIALTTGGKIIAFHRVEINNLRYYRSQMTEGRR